MKNEGERKEGLGFEIKKGSHLFGLCGQVGWFGILYK
jgi:hypothetical protein